VQQFLASPISTASGTLAFHHEASQIFSLTIHTLVPAAVLPDLASAEGLARFNRRFFSAPSFF
jgi:hypothetical protein